LRRIGKFWRRVFVGLLAGCAAFLIACGVLVCAGLHDDDDSADVAVVPGNTVRPDGSPSPRLAARLDRALELYRAGRVPLIFVSGGVGKEGWDESEVMRGYLIDRGVPTCAVIADNDGGRTLATAVNLRRVMVQQKLTSALVVTQYFHVPRTKLALQKVGVGTVYSVHARFFEMRDLYSIPREVIGFVRYLGLRRGE
jgi:vancomycin permeability regulator SanA